MVEFPEGGKAEGENMVGELSFIMYEMGDAAQNWGEECASAMTRIGFHRGAALPCTFGHPDRGLGCYIHGDDFVTVGSGKDSKWMRAGVEQT